MTIDERDHRSLTEHAITLREAIGAQRHRTLIRIGRDGDDYFEGDAQQLVGFVGAQIATARLEARLPGAARPLVIAHDPGSGNGIEFSLGGIPCTTPESVGPAMRNAMAIAMVLEEPDRPSAPLILTGTGLDVGHRLSAVGLVESALKVAAIVAPHVDLSVPGALDDVSLEGYELRTADSWESLDLAHALDLARDRHRIAIGEPAPESDEDGPEFG
ncbi:hypothetical protein [Paracoccus sp. ME4]|uniref:hypothetical protein n=1 Tax=Paracoccus sp. ME4 TaxID=3138066 RepID=UPI00398B5690